MTKFEEFQARKIKTVGELIKKLQELPINATFDISDADIGGYDVSDANYVDMYYMEKSNIVRFGHMEKEIYDAQNEGLITRKEEEELNKNTKVIFIK